MQIRPAAKPRDGLEEHTSIKGNIRGENRSGLYISDSPDENEERHEGAESEGDSQNLMSNPSEPGPVSAGEVGR